MKDYRLVVQTTRPIDHDKSVISYDDAIMIKREDGIIFKKHSCNGELLAYYPLTWAIEITEVIFKHEIEKL